MKDRYAYFLLGGFFGGIALSSFFTFHISFSLFTALLSGALLLYFLLLRKNAVMREGKMFLACLFVFSFSLGVFRYDLSDRNKNPLPENILGKSIAAEGVVTDMPDQRDTSTNLTVSLDSIGASPVSAKVLVSADRYSDFRYGDRVALSGTLAYPENFTDETGRAFDYVSYLGKDDVYYVMKYPKISLIAHDAGNPVRAFLFGVKDAFISKINDILNPPQSSFLAGILVAGKASLGKELQDEFVRAGAIQIVVLSGYNVTIVAEAMMSLLASLSRAWGFASGILGIIAFTLMVGASASVVRASIMAIMVIFGKMLGRQFDVLRALVIAGFFMVLQNPKILVFDPSFQLSFLSMLGLIFFTPLLFPKFTFVPVGFKLRETVVSTLAAQLFVLPYLLFQIGSLSLVAVFVNALIMLFIPVTMFVGFVATCLGFLSIWVAFPFTFISYILLSYELGVVHFFASLPFAAISLNYFPVLLMLAVYVFYGCLLYRSHRKEKAVEISTTFHS